MSIRVLIADDSALARGLLRAIFEQEGDIEVVGEATDGHEAVALASALRPSLVTMDLEMPGLHGLEAIDAIMRAKALPILVVSSVADARNACEALRRGALEVIAKPSGPEEAAELIAKVRLLADLVVVTAKTSREREEALRREAEAMDSLRPGEDMVGLAQAFQFAEEEYRPGEGKKK